MVRYGDEGKAVWFNEYGWNAAPVHFTDEQLIWERVTEEQQAEYTLRGIEYARTEWPWAGVFNIWYFRQVGGADRVLALVVDGDPHDDECFPGALLEGPDGARREPLAADVRKYADGKHLALLKIIAGILGIRLDELRRRRRLVSARLSRYSGP